MAIYHGEDLSQTWQTIWNGRRACTENTWSGYNFPFCHYIYMRCAKIAGLYNIILNFIQCWFYGPFYSLAILAHEGHYDIQLLDIALPKFIHPLIFYCYITPGYAKMLTYMSDYWCQYYVFATFQVMAMSTFRNSINSFKGYCFDQVTVPMTPIMESEEGRGALLAFTSRRSWLLLSSRSNFAWGPAMREQQIVSKIALKKFNSKSIESWAS